jgi:hypothetical protein
VGTVSNCALARCQSRSWARELGHQAPTETGVELLAFGQCDLTVEILPTDAVSVLRGNPYLDAEKPRGDRSLTAANT